MADNSTEKKKSKDAESRKDRFKSKGKEITGTLANRGRQAKALLRCSKFGHNRKQKQSSVATSTLDQNTVRVSSAVSTPDQDIVRISCAASTPDNNTVNISCAVLVRRWLSSFTRSDPRSQIARFFDDLAQQGAADIENSKELVPSPLPPMLRPFAKASVFTVWRPTSFVAIRRMIAGEATGKGLEIKGKSAKEGRLSGFVPYLQIDKEEDKARVGTLPRGGRTRVFFETKEARNKMVKELEPLQNQMVNAVAQAKLLLRDTAVTGLTPFSAASRLAASGLSRPLGRSLTRASATAATGLEPLRTGINKASEVTNSGLKPIKRAVCKTSSAVVSAMNPLRQSLSNGSDKSYSNAPTAVARKSLLRASISGDNRAKSDSGKDRDEEEDEREWALTRILFDMDDPSIKILDKYAPDCYGIELPDRLLWKGCVSDRDISRPEGSEFYTGRVSQPAFQDLNFKAIWKTQKIKKGLSSPSSSSSDVPRVVLWQTLSRDDPDDDPTDPRGLIMAYEENGRVLPVVSDFDCFTVGTRSVRYETPLPKAQAELVQWEVSQIESILDEQSSKPTRSTWTSCWLGVLKTFAAKGFNPYMPRFGFGDKKSYSIMECAVSRLSTCGAVRHGSESFNYFFPQELDEEFLIVSDTLPGNVPWKYVDVKELQEFLMERVDDGYTFALNPKWILCDEGWFELYDRLMKSDKPNVQESVNVWFPPETGIRERIESIHERHPRGFVQEKRDIRMSGTEAMDLATLELDRYLAFRRAKTKLRAVVAFNDLLVSVRKRHAAEDACCPDVVDSLSAQDEDRHDSAVNDSEGELAGAHAIAN